MVFSIVSFGARRGLAQSFIRSGLAKRISGEAIIRSLRAAGLTYRRTDMLADVRTFRGVSAVRPALQAIRKDFYPSERMYRSPKKFMLRKFAYEVKVKFLDPRTKIIKTQYTRISSDTPMRIMDAEAKARDFFRPPADEYDFANITFTIDSAFLKPGESVLWTE